MQQMPGSGGRGPCCGSSQAQQTLQLRKGLLQIAIHQHRIEFRSRRQFLPGPFKAPSYRRLAVGAPAANPSLQLGKAGRRQKNLLGGRKALPHLSGPFQLNFQQHRPLLQVALHRLPRRAVEVACELGPLQKVARRDALLKIRAAEKEIVPAIQLTLPG